MSLLRKALEEATDLVDDKAEGWVDDGVEGLRDLTAELEGDELELANVAIAEVEKGKATLVRFGKLRFAELVAYFEDDDQAEAKRLVVETEMTFDERIAWQERQTATRQTEEQERDETWDAVVAIFEAIGKEALPILGKILGRLIGLPL